MIGALLKVTLGVTLILLLVSVVLNAILLGTCHRLRDERDELDSELYIRTGRE